MIQTPAQTPTAVMTAAIPPDPAMVVKTLRGVAEALERGWCQHALALMPFKGSFPAWTPGHVWAVSPLDSRVTQMCLEGAVYYALFTLLGLPWDLNGTTERQQAELSALTFAVVGSLKAAIGGREASLPRWNDTEGRTQQDVVTLVRGTADRLEARLA